jgi:hypothetical protein
MNAAVVWDFAPSRLEEIDRHIGGAYCLHLQGDEIDISKVTANLNEITQRNIQKTVIFMNTYKIRFLREVHEMNE